MNSNPKFILCGSRLLFFYTVGNSFLVCFRNICMNGYWWRYLTSDLADDKLCSISTTAVPKGSVLSQKSCKNLSKGKPLFVPAANNDVLILLEEWFELLTSNGAC